MGYTSKMLCLQAMVVLCILSSVNGQCPELKFPSIGNGDTYSAEDGFLLDLNFEIDTKERKIEYTITVSKQDTEGGISEDICRMLVLSNGTCISFRPDECKCNEQQRRYSLVKTLDKSDATFWKWKVESNGCITAERKIRFNIQDSPTKRPPTTLKTSGTTVSPKTTKTPGTGTEAKYTTTNTTTGHSSGERVAVSPLVIGIVIAVVVLVVIIALATVLAVRRRRGLPLFRRASGLRDPITFRRPDSKMPADNQEGYLYPTSLNQTAPEEGLNMTPRPPPRTAINPEYEFQPQSGTLQRFEV